MSKELNETLPTVAPATALKEDTNTRVGDQAAISGRFKKLSPIVLSILVLVGVGASFEFAATEVRPAEVKPLAKAVTATQDLQSFRLLQNSDLKADDQAEIKYFENRYLLVRVSKGSEIKKEMVSRGKTEGLEDAVAVGIPASVIGPLGSQLHPGDIVDVIAIPKSPAQAGNGNERFEGLVVLPGAPKSKGTEGTTESQNGLSVAIPRSKHEAFAKVTANSTLVVARKLMLKD